LIDVYKRKREREREREREKTIIFFSSIGFLTRCETKYLVRGSVSEIIFMPYKIYKICPTKFA
jgi:hypothetical protein